MLRLLLLYRFWLTEICICRKPRPTRDETHDLQIALPMMFMLPFFYTSGTLPSKIHSRQLRGKPFCSSLLVSFFRCCYERNSIRTASLSHFISLVHSAHHLFFFFSSSRGRLLDSCSACIYSASLVVSLNNEPQLAHQRQQSAGSAFQFHYNNLKKERNNGITIAASCQISPPTIDWSSTNLSKAMDSFIRQDRLYFEGPMQDFDVGVKVRYLLFRPASKAKR